MMSPEDIKNGFQRPRSTNLIGLPNRLDNSMVFMKCQAPMCCEAIRGLYNRVILGYAEECHRHGHGVA